MNEAQQEWKTTWQARNDWREPRYWMKRIRREAALERKLEAAQRTIKAQAQRIAELDATLKDIATAPYENQPNDGNEWEKEYYLRGLHR